MLSRGRYVAVLAVTAVVTAACVHQRDPTVQIKDLQADIVFGLKPTTTVPPVPPALPIAQPAQINVPTSPGISESPPFTLPINLPTLTQAPSACPPAALEAFPDATAPVLVTSAPKVGAYKWQLGGDRVEGINIQQVNGFETRLIRRATSIPKINTDAGDSIDYTFQMVEPLGSKSGVLELTYQVRSHNNGQVYEQPPAGTGNNVYAASPDAGLSLIGEDIVDPSGGRTPVFHPAEPFLLVPLPIQPGSQYESVATDPSSGTVVSFQGTVLRRARVDACGAVVEGWEVNGVERFVSPPPPGTGAPTLGTLLDTAFNTTEAASVDDIYATQFGGMLIAEHTLQTVNFLSETIDNAIGQEKPSPLPAGTA